MYRVSKKKPSPEPVETIEWLDWQMQYRDSITQPWRTVQMGLGENQNLKWRYKK